MVARHVLFLLLSSRGFFLVIFNVYIHISLGELQIRCSRRDFCLGYLKTGPHSGFRARCSVDQGVTGLTSDERDEVGRGYGQLVNLMAKMERVLNLPAPTPALPPVDQSQIRPSAALSTCTEAAAAASQNGIKRKQILPPSPEKLQKHHQSHAIH
ncbi:hypothetical protein DFH08DRAFT_802445 [Mycena albidolilacea]|uniref:Uncharacterized protein n=1 Tax=Mycena albidolilacea TaxID=1033008 RepID=A0AAD7AE50_9AGAR|nr:hypothetical protein DFH08DRAFT_802445 [Mycena albidolilacea]